MSIQSEPHFEVPSAELATWIEKQGTAIWWNVDGDPLLTDRVAFPAQVTSSPKFYAGLTAPC